MAGYGIYQGTSGLPYSVGGDSGMGASQTQPGVGGGGEMSAPTQAQSSPGAYGAASYASLMPQWMQDYFDANVAGQGYDSLNAQRNLGTEGLQGLKARYGDKAALNPYFAQNGIQKGFDPFHNSVYTSQQNIIPREGNLNPYLPDWLNNQQQTITNQRDPFSGAVQGTQWNYSALNPPKSNMGGGHGYGENDGLADILTGGMYSLNKGLIGAGKGLF